jgi:drug/metabolite transporter (DMT)-like permease
MIPLIVSILCSSLIFVIFKLFPKYGINTFQAIVFNYFTAFTCGILLFGKDWNPKALESGNWPYFVVLSAVLFISLFIVMGISSQKNGVALTSIAGKMSMGLSMLFMIGLYSEPLSFLKVAGILLAFLGVFLVSFAKSNDGKSSNSIWLLIVLFVGSAILDVVLNYVQKFEFKHIPASLFSAFGFGLAGAIGFTILVIQLLRKSAKFELKNILAGIMLGIPNYFSIYLLILSYKSTGWTDSTVLAIMNVSTVLISAVIGFIAFRENVTVQKIIGLLAAVSAIILLYFANLN